MRKHILILLVAVLLIAVPAIGQLSTFNYTGAVQTYTVPACVFSLSVDVKGAEGAGGPPTASVNLGGKGGRVQATIAVTPGEILNIYVGEKPLTNVGGWNGGGTAGSGTTAGGGGGASDIRQGGTALSNRIIVGAGGGGGANTCAAGNDGGGNGGGLTGQPGWDCNISGGPGAGGGGSQTAGGNAATGCAASGSTAGTLGQGGQGGTNAGIQPGGGGGGGYYGGGGGNCRGGGGGSSFSSASATSVTNSAGFQLSNGQILITPIPSGGPAMPGSIMGPSSVCAGSTAAFSISNVPGATTYNWSAPAGSAITGGGTAAVSITFGSASGTISVTASNACGTSPSQTMAITINPAPPAPTVSSNSPLCEGTTLNLTADSIAGAIYSWTGPNLFNTSMQNPSISSVTQNEAGTYSLTVTVNGCTSAVATTTVVINPIPAATTAVNNSPFCEGGTLTMTAGNVAGATYAWTGPNNYTSSTFYTWIGNAMVSASGTYSVTVTVNGCTSAPATTNVMIYPFPLAPTAGSNSPLCQGITLNLTAGNIPGATYSWMGPNGFFSMSQNPTLYNVTAGEAGIYDVTVTVDGCTSAPTSIIVTINQNPTVTFTGLSSGYCLANPTATLTGNPAGGTFSGPGIIGNTFEPYIAGIGNHTIIYTYSDANGCQGSHSLSTSVSNNAFVNLGPDMIICDDTSFVLTPGTFYGYSWHDNSTNATFTVDGATLGVGLHTLYVNIIDANGCTGSDTIIIQVVNCPIGLSESTPLLVGIFPNPTEGIITITINNFQNDKIELRLMNIFGQVVLEKNVHAAGGYFEQSLDLSGLAKGIYSLEISDRNMLGVYKVALQ